MLSALFRLANYVRRGEIARLETEKKPLKINGFWKAPGSRGAVSSVVEHFLDTDALRSEQSLALQLAVERITLRTEFRSDPVAQKPGRSRLLVRIARGLYRYAPSGTIYWCRKTNGKNVWRSLRTTDKKRAMAISFFCGYAEFQNGNHEVIVLPEGIAPTLPGRQIEVGAVRIETVAPASPPNQNVSPEQGRASTTLNDLVARFRAESNGLAATTRENMNFHFRVAARHLDFGRNIRDIRVGDLRKLKSDLAEARKPSTVNDILFKGLGALFKIAVEDELIDKSPLEKLKRSKASEPDRAQPTWEQSQQIVDTVAQSAPETAIIIGFMRHFGIGQAEIMNLCGEHIDTDSGVIHIRRKKTTKVFEVPVFPHAKAFIERLKTEGRLQVGTPVVQWRNPRKAFESACKDLGLPHYTPRSLRRCFIVHALEIGVDVRLVSQWQAHSDTTLIFKVYGKHISKEHADRMAQKLQ